MKTTTTMENNNNNNCNVVQFSLLTIDSLDVSESLHVHQTRVVSEADIPDGCAIAIREVGAEVPEGDQIGIALYGELVAEGL